MTHFPPFPQTKKKKKKNPREFRYLGMERWKLQEMVAVLPMLIQISLLLFAIGLVLFLFYISKPSFGVTTAIFGIGVIYYAITTTISVFVTSLPFHSPLSRIFGRLYQPLHAYFCPALDHFLSPHMDTTPVTRLGSFGRRIQISLQKFRPYSEKEFENPITAATVDEFQLSTASSALQRIHNSVPNSQHSQSIHQSVWQVAGSPALRLHPLFKLPSCVLDRGSDKEYFSQFSPAGVVGLTSVFVRMHDARYKERISAMRHIRSNTSYSQEPRAQLVYAVFDLLPDNFFPDKRHALLHPASISNALRHDALLHGALPDVPLLDTLRKTLLLNALRNAPVRDNALHLPDPPLRDTTFFDTLFDTLRRLLTSFSRSLSAMNDARLRCVPRPAPDNRVTVPVLLGYTLRVCCFGLRVLGFTVLFISALGGLAFRLALSGAPSSTVAAMIDLAISGPLAVLHLRGVLLSCDDGFRHNVFRDAFAYAYYDAQHYAPFFAELPTVLFEALVLVYALLRNTLEDPYLYEPLHEALFRKAPYRSSLRLLFLINPRLDAMTTQGRIMRAHLEPEEPKVLINILQQNRPHDEDSIWLLNTLSALHCDGLVLLQVSKICLTILLQQAPRWNQKTPPNIMLIEAVVTLAAISCSSNETYQRETLTNSLQHPWLLLNLRNPELISRMIENVNQSSRKELISLLFLVVYGLFLRGSKALVAQYLAIITAKSDFPLCASALAVITQALGDDAFFAIGRSLLAPQTQFLTPEVNGSMSDSQQIGLSHHSLFHNFDLQLGAGQFPDPESLAILLLLSKNLDPHVEQQLQGTDLKLRNPWLQLVANVIARLDIPDESGMDFKPFHDHRVYNMIAALSLSRYSERKVVHSTARESLLLASFLPSREFIISSLALHHYLETVTSYSSPLPPSCYLPCAVHALFSPILPYGYLPEGWKILHMFVDGFEKLSIEWRQTFAEAFFTVSHRPLLCENGKDSTLVTELKGILTWEYFCKEGREPEFTDRVFSGLDWMALAWSLHLSQQSSTMTAILAQRAAQPPGLREPPEDKEFVLRVLCRLLDAAPYYSILPIIPKLHEFVEWFDDAKLLNYQSMVSAHIEGAEEEYERYYKFQKVNCTWYL